MIKKDYADLRQDVNLVRVLVMAVYLFGCQTLPKFDPGSLPPRLTGHFQPCYPSDGGLEVHTFLNGQRSMVFSLDWKSDKPGVLRADAVDILGRTILEIGVADREIQLAGRGAATIPPLSADDEGYLAVGGHRVGVRIDELACLLGFRLPRFWLDQAVSFNPGAEASELVILDHNRKVFLTFYHDYVYRTDRICAQLQWKSMWGLRTDSVTWCKENRGGRQWSTLHDDTRTFIEWTEDESENP